MNEVCTFRLGSLHFGLDVRHIQEVVQGLPLTMAPRTRRFIGGLLNLRGRVVAAVDLRECIPELERERPDDQINIIVDGRSHFSLLVDDVGDVITIDAAAIRHIPVTVPESIKQFLTGVYLLEEGLLLLLDPDHTLNALQGTSV